MRASRYRLRFVPGISYAGSSYGSGLYGDGTYGQRATDTLNAYRYWVVPLPGGTPIDPSWIRRSGDFLPPIRIFINSEVGRLNLTGVDRAHFILTAVDGRDIRPYLYEGVIDDATGLIALTRNTYGQGLYGDGTYGQRGATPRIPPGLYRVVVMLEMLSGRRLCVPGDDNLRIQIFPLPAIQPIAPIWQIPGSVHA